MPAILVLGATGTVGSELVARLLQRGVSVRCASRSPGAAATSHHWPVHRVATVELDLERPATFAAAIEGADRAFLIARPGDERPEAVALPLIDAFRRGGVRHVVNLTALGVERADHAVGLRRVELYLEASGIAFTHLRPNFFMQLFSSPPLLEQIRTTRTLRVAAGDARLSFIDARDIAAVAAVALCETGHEGRAYSLTGPESIDHADVARQISAATGVEIRYVPLGESEARAMLSGAGFSAERIERLTRFYRLVRSGAAAPVTPDVPAVLGRPARSFAEFARDHAAVWV